MKKTAIFATVFALSMCISACATAAPRHAGRAPQHRAQPTETWNKTGTIQVPIEEVRGPCTPGERTYVNGVMRVCRGQVTRPTGRECRHRINPTTGVREEQCRPIQHPQG